MIDANTILKGIEEDWDDLGDKLYSGKIQYDDIEGLKKEKFLNRFNDMFSPSSQFAVVELSEINLLLRSCKGKDEVKDKYRFRSLKKEDGEKWEENKHKLATNRYNEPERGFMYFGISMENNPKDSEDVKKTCIKEIRAFKDEETKYVSTLEFKVPDENKHKKVLDFSKISKYKSCDEIVKVFSEKINLLVDEYSKIENQRIKSGEYTKEQSNRLKYLDKEISIIEDRGVVKLLVEMYLKFINDATFTKVEDDKKRKYAPFHAFANYIEYMGYSGIIYNSTVHSGGLNLVLFDRDDVDFYGEIKGESLN